jgi:DNA mismatch repair protein MutL
VINGTPAGLNAVSEVALFEGLLEQYKLNKTELSLSKQDNLARSLAKKSSVAMGMVLNPAERNSIIDELFACENPNYAPDGRLTYFILDLNQINNYFT